MDEIHQWEKSICDTDTSVMDRPDTSQWIALCDPLAEMVLRWKGELVTRFMLYARLPCMEDMEIIHGWVVTLTEVGRAFFWPLNLISGEIISEAAKESMEIIMEPAEELLYQAV